MIRFSYPDELPRIQSILAGSPVPGNAQFIVSVKEQPVERILAAVAWWLEAGDADAPPGAIFSLHAAGAVDLGDEDLQALLAAVEDAARKEGAHRLLARFSVPEKHPLFQKLTSLGYASVKFDRHFIVPGEIVKSRSIRIYRRVAPRIPEGWKVESIKGHCAEAVFALVAQHGLMPQHEFMNYWDASNRERFEDEYSCVAFEGDTMIGAFLLTRRGEAELHIHVEAVATEKMAVSHLVAAALRNFSFSHCVEGFPKVFSWRADSDRHQQTANSALRQGGEERPPQHFLSKSLRDSA